jgi:hypothetical protein
VSATRRIDSGRGHTYRLDGQAVDGVTTIINQGIPKPAIASWAARETAGYAYDQLDVIGGLERDEAIDLLKGAPWRDRDRAANRGTAVHRLAEQLAAGTEVQVPDELVGHVDAYLRFLDDWQPDIHTVEFVGGNRRHRYMGTGDAIMGIPGHGLVLVDLKTNRSGPFGEVALQLAAYRYFEFILVDGAEQPMPEVASCAVIWLRADGYDLYPYRAGPEEFRYFLYAKEVARFCSEHAQGCRQDAIYPPARAAV